MLFQFDIHLTDKDYFDLNAFWMIRSHYGKKQMLQFRVIIAAIIALFAFLFLFGEEFSADSLFMLIPYAIILILLQVFLPFFLDQTVSTR